MSIKSIDFKDVNVGDKLPELAVDLTSTLIVGGALASQDYTPVHHDKAAAQAQGMQDVFMNILTTNGLVGRTSPTGPVLTPSSRGSPSSSAPPTSQATPCG